MFAACFDRAAASLAGDTHISAAVAEGMASALDPFEQAEEVGSWTGGHAAVAMTQFRTSAAVAPQSIPHVDDAGRAVAAWIRLDNRPELLTALRFDGDATATTNEAILLAAYDRWGVDCVEHLRGDFSFVIHDPLDGTVFVARDPFGVRPCYYHLSDGLFAVSTTAAAFHTLDDLTLTPNESWIARFVIGQSMSHTATAYEEVAKLPGGHRLQFRLGDSTDTVQPQCWFEFTDDAPMAVVRDEAWVERYRRVLVEAVTERIDTDAPLGVETSGGIDSSTCLGVAADVWTRSVDEIHAFGYLTSEDEPDFIEETSRMHRIDNTVIFDTADRVARRPDPERVLTVLGYPEEHSNASAHTPIYLEAQQRGVRVLLSGFGGDEGVTNPGQLLDRELIDHRRFGVLWSEMFGPWWQKPLRFARRIQRGRRGSRMSSELSRVVRRRWADVMLAPDVVQRYDLEREYLDRASFDDGFRTINEFVLGNRVYAPFVPTRLENCSLMAQSYGIDYRWPLLDPELVQQYLSTPSIEKRKQSSGRFLHRRAIEGVVPPKVQWKPGKDMGPPLVTRDLSNQSAHDVDLEDLHPLLDAVIDTARLVASLESGDTGDIDRLRTVSRQIARIGTADRWLRRFHPATGVIRAPHDEPDTDAANISR